MTYLTHVCMYVYNLIKWPTEMHLYSAINKLPDIYINTSVNNFSDYETNR